MPLNTYTFKKELFTKVFRFAHKRPVIYWMNYNTRDRFVDNTKDRWRKDQDLQNKEDLLDEISELKRYNYWVNSKFNETGMIDTSYMLRMIKKEKDYLTLKKK